MTPGWTTEDQMSSKRELERRVEELETANECLRTQLAETEEVLAECRAENEALGTRLTELVRRVIPSG